MNSNTNQVNISSNKTQQLKRYVITKTDRRRGFDQGNEVTFTKSNVSVNSKKAILFELMMSRQIKDVLEGTLKKTKVSLTITVPTMCIRVIQKSLSECSV